MSKKIDPIISDFMRKNGAKGKKKRWSTATQEEKAAHMAKMRAGKEAKKLSTGVSSSLDSQGDRSIME